MKHPSCFNVDLEFEYDENDAVTGVIVGKISNLPIGDRLWPNCLDRPIRNSSRVKVDDFMARYNKISMKQELGLAEKVLQKSAASRTRIKQTITPVMKGLQSIQSLSSKSQDIPQEAKEMEISSSRLYAKGICHSLCLLVCFLIMFSLSAMLLTLIEPFYMIVEFKTPTIKPLIISSRELFSKRTRDDKSTETDSSKAPFSLLNSPLPRKFVLILLLVLLSLIHPFPLLLMVTILVLSLLPFHIS